MSQIPDPILIDIPMPIVTPRLILEIDRPGFGHHLHEMKEETIEDLLLWEPWAHNDQRTPDADEANCRKAYADFILRKDMRMIGFERENPDRAVMMCGLHRFDWTARRFEIGYWVRKSAQGRGYATEAANALIRFAFGALSARRVDIIHADGNERSRRVIEKLGFEKEYFRKDDAVMPDGRFISHHGYVRFDTDGLPDLNVEWR
jgi:RimJ/RimL family protein N-acetyltransferase